MSVVAVRATGLSKRYSLDAAGNGDDLKETLSQALQRPLRALRAKADAEPPTRTRDEIWALRDVSFEIAEGEVVGIIGRNGAGKSTLLKILSRITEPTRGRAEIYGRVASLLEVGTGFHFELTGRENIYLNGAILGMRRSEIDRKFEEIVSFAEVERFIDTPVKRYSSGMYMRLAFAVAAHLEPEVLIVDEVLSVGDIFFQRKCMGKMGDVASSGRTVLFVSHNMAAVASLCRTAILLESGRIIAAGPAEEVVQRYHHAVVETTAVPLADRIDRGGDGSVRFVSLRVANADGGDVITSGSRLRISLDYESESPVQHPRVLATVADPSRGGIFLLDSETDQHFPAVLPPTGTLTCVTDPILLTAGKTYVHLELSRGSALADEISFAGSFEVVPDDFYASGRLPERDWVTSLRHHRWSVGEPQ